MRWALSGVLALMELGIVLGNILGPVAARKRGGGFSFVLLFGGLFGAAACLVCPWDKSAWLIPAALLVDFTIPMMLVVGARSLLRRARREGRPE
jgi:predicted MFS family arabinose efflux permease